MNALVPPSVRAPHERPEAVLAAVLLIEDDPPSQQLVERTLSFAGYRVRVARRALEGIELARHERPDLILTDLNLPDLSGHDLVAALRQEPALRGVPIVAISADANAGGRGPAAAAGLAGFLPKPLDVENLPRAVAAVLNGAAAGATNAVAASGHAEALEQGNAELQRQVDARDALLRLSAHQLRTPMSLITGYRQLIEANPRLQKVLEADGEAAQLISGLTTAMARMQSSVDELALLSRVITGRVEPVMRRVRVAEAVARSVSAFTEPMRERGIALRFERVSFPSTIDADEALLDLVFRNLLSNAVRFTPNGGSITLSARVIPGAVPGGLFRFSVRDSGVGIAAADLIRIFTVYTSVPAGDLNRIGQMDFLSPGLGLGLAASKQIVDAHGGRLWAESPGYDPERCPGSELILVLPVKDPRSA